MWTVYALYNNKTGKIYIGETSNLERRLLEHNQKRGRHFTARQRGAWKLIYKEMVSTKQQALRREKELKSFRGREFIKKFIQIKSSAPL